MEVAHSLFIKKLLEIQDSLYNFALNLTMDGYLALHLLQDTFLETLIYKDKYEENTDIKDWACDIMQNTFTNEYIRDKCIKTFSDNSNALNLLNIPNLLTSDKPNDYYAIKEINNTIALLPKDYRIPFSLYVAGYNYKDIANNLNIPLGTVKSRIFFISRKFKIFRKDYL